MVLRRSTQGLPLQPKTTREAAVAPNHRLESAPSHQQKNENVPNLNQGPDLDQGQPLQADIATEGPGQGPLQGITAADTIGHDPGLQGGHQEGLDQGHQQDITKGTHIATYQPMDIQTIMATIQITEEIIRRE
mmetsp:Transcript_8843/g.12186  ORF Transcript_8843/g.12186 Transcript_8843/m.12186 type:complete len:133 (+) Transcript_8843:367-765(+)